MSLVMNHMKRSVGARIRERRKARNWTQEDLGAEVNVSAQVISNWERGYSTPSSSDIQALSAALKATADYLLCNTDDPQHVLSEDTSRFLEVVDLEDEQAIEELKSHFVYKGKKLPEPLVREILHFARYRLKEEE